MLRTTYTPASLDSVAGCYYSSTGMGGELLELRRDGTYFHQLWTDILDPDDRGQEGEYQVVGDVAVLRFKSLVLDSILRFTPDELAVTGTSETGVELAKRLESIRESEDEIRRIGHTEVFRFKKIDSMIFAVPQYAERWFAQQVLENGGMPPLMDTGSGPISMYFPARLDPSRCPHHN